MEGALKLWTVIVAVGLANYLAKLSFIAYFSRRAIPPLLARALKYVPAAMLTALIVPMIAGPAGAAAALDPKAAAALLAGAVAWFTGNTPMTIAAGMAALWLLQAAA
jgi:branched-subunit amino acid transport protein